MTTRQWLPANESALARPNGGGATPWWARSAAEAGYMACPGGGDNWMLNAWSFLPSATFSPAGRGGTNVLHSFSLVALWRGENQAQPAPPPAHPAHRWPWRQV